MNIFTDEKRNTVAHKLHFLRQQREKQEANRPHLSLADYMAETGTDEEIDKLLCLLQGLNNRYRY